MTVRMRDEGNKARSKRSNERNMASTHASGGRGLAIEERGDARQLAPFEEFERCPATCRDVCIRRGEAQLRDERHRLAAADHHGCIELREKLRQLRRSLRERFPLCY